MYVMFKSASHNANLIIIMFEKRNTLQ